MEAKREALIYFHFNLFDAVYAYYKFLIKKDQIDDKYWESWCKFAYIFFRDCSEAREIIVEPNTQEIYSSEFVSYIKTIIGQSKVGKFNFQELI